MICGVLQMYWEGVGLTSNSRALMMTLQYTRSGGTTWSAVLMQVVTVTSEPLCTNDNAAVCRLPVSVTLRTACCTSDRQAASDRWCGGRRSCASNSSQKPKILVTFAGVKNVALSPNIACDVRRLSRGCLCVNFMKPFGHRFFFCARKWLGSADLNWLLECNNLLIFLVRGKKGVYHKAVGN